MSPRQFPRTLILFLLLAGGGVRQEATAVSEDRTAVGPDASVSVERQKALPSQLAPSTGPIVDREKELEQPQRYRVYRTPETKAWPSYRLPLDIEIKAPEVPKEILGPSAPIQEESSGGSAR